MLYKTRLAFLYNHNKPVVSVQKLHLCIPNNTICIYITTLKAIHKNIRGLCTKIPEILHNNITWLLWNNDVGDTCTGVLLALTPQIQKKDKILFLFWSYWFVSILIISLVIPIVIITMTLPMCYLLNIVNIYWFMMCTV